MALLVKLRSARGGLSGRRNIPAARPLQDFFGSIDFVRRIAMNGKENSADRLTLTHHVDWNHREKDVDY